MMSSKLGDVGFSNASDELLAKESCKRFSQLPWVPCAAIPLISNLVAVFSVKVNQSVLQDTRMQHRRPYMAFPSAKA
jgi:hypothetical protein